MTTLPCANYLTMILAANRRFFAKGPKIASDKLAFLYGRLTKIHLWIIRPVTEPNEKALRAILP